MKKRIWLGSLLAAGALMITGLDDAAQAYEEEGAKTLWGEILPAETDPDGDGWANMGFDPTWMSQEAQNEINQLAYDKDFGDLSQVAFNEAVAVIWQREEAHMAGQYDGHYEYSDDYYYDDYYYGYEDGYYDGYHDGYYDGYHDGYHDHHYYDVHYYDHYYYDYYYYDHHYYDHHDYGDKVWHDEIHPLNVDISYDNLAYLAMHEPETLNSGPLNAHPYEHYFIHEGYEYHFMFDGVCWIWSYAPVGH